jgi:hypothetical protein
MQDVGDIPKDHRFSQTFDKRVILNWMQVGPQQLFELIIKSKKGLL